MKSFQLHSYQITREEKVIKYFGLFTSLLLLTPFGGFAIMIFPLSFIFLIPAFSIPLSKFVIKNKSTRNIIIAIDIAIIAIALYVDIYFIATGGNIIGL